MSYRDIIEPYWDRVTHEDWETFARQFAALPSAAKHLYSTHWTQSEVQNGGLGQYFHNSTGILAPEAVEGFRALQMPRTAEALVDAISLFGDEYPRDRKARENVIPPTLVEDRFSELLETEAGGYWDAADRFAASHAS